MRGYKKTTKFTEGVIRVSTEYKPRFILRQTSLQTTHSHIRLLLKTDHCKQKCNCHAYWQIMNSFIWLYEQFLGKNTNITLKFYTLSLALLIWLGLILFTLVKIPSANMDEVRFVTYTAASHPVAIEILWLTLVVQSYGPFLQFIV